MNRENRVETEAGTKASLERIQSSPNYREGKFVNSLPNEEPPFIETTIEWIKGGDHTTPQQALPVLQRKGGDFDTLPESGLRVTWLGHSTTLVEIDGKRILIDPVWGQRVSPFRFAGPKRFFQPPLPLDELPDVDAVLISHDHYDHLDKPTIERLAGRDLFYIVPLGIGRILADWGISWERIRELDWWEYHDLDDLRVRATPARHFSGRSVVIHDRDRTLWTGFALSGPRHNLYYTGDTSMFPGFREIGEKLGPFDATLVEVGAYHRLWADVHLGPEQAVEAVRQAKGGILIPVHWATFDLAMHSWIEPAERLLAACEEAGQALVIPRPGESIDPLAPPAISRWWPDLPWQSVEEHEIRSSGMDHATLLRPTGASCAEHAPRMKVRGLQANGSRP